jgi:hypothetical protein
MTDQDREAAWSAVHQACRPAGGLDLQRSTPASGRGSVTARGPHPGRSMAPQTVSGTGENETAALRDLDDRLRGVPKPGGTSLDPLRRRLRLAYVDGAETWTRENLGRVGLSSGRSQFRTSRRCVGRPLEWLACPRTRSSRSACRPGTSWS